MAMATSVYVWGHGGTVALVFSEGSGLASSSRGSVQFGDLSCQLLEHFILYHSYEAGIVIMTLYR